jgi:hypothetical protein
VGDADATLGAARRARGHDLTATRLAVRTAADRIAAIRALAFPDSSSRRSAREIALQDGKRPDRGEDAEERENQRSELERIDVVRDVVGGEDDCDQRRGSTIPYASGMARE